MRAKREEEDRKRQEELRRQQEEILRRQQEEERKRREEEELARRKQVCLRTLLVRLALKEGLRDILLTPVISQVIVLLEKAPLRHQGVSRIGIRILGDSLPFRKNVCHPLTPTGGIFFSPSNSLELIAFTYFLGFYKPVRFQK